MRDQNGLIDRIYEAGGVATLWPSLLRDLGNTVGGNGGFLFAVRDGYLSSVASPNNTEVAQRFMEEGWANRDQALKRALANQHAGFLTDFDLFTPDEIETDEVYSSFYRKNGIGFRAGTIIKVPTGDSIALVVPRRHEDGPVPREVVAFLDGLRPHLARSALIASRQGFERARRQAEVLQALDIPAAVLMQQGRVLAANAAFEDLIPDVFRDGAARIAVNDPVADAIFEERFAEKRLKGVLSIPVRATATRKPMIAHIVPVQGVARDVFDMAAAILVVTIVDRGAVPSAEVLEGLFDLTPAEARVARLIGGATSLERVADMQGISRETVRSHLKAILSKTGVNRQAELVCLLSGAVMGNSPKGIVEESAVKRKPCAYDGARGEHG